MWRWLRAFVLATALIAPGFQFAAAQSASVAVSVTVLPAPFVLEMGPGCAFVLTDKAKTVDCVVTAVFGQATYSIYGWRGMLTVTKVRDPISGETIESRNVTLISAEAFNLTWGQAVDPVGGPFVPSKAFNGPYNHKQTLVAAKPGFGNGGYKVVLQFRLRAPASQTPGVYVPTWKIEIANSYS